MDQSGFNRVEVLVMAVVVIAILMMAIFFIFELQSFLRDTKRKSDIETISKALEANFNRQTDEHCDAPTDSYCPPKGIWFFNDQIPSDPLTGIYLTLPKAGDKIYVICAKLEIMAGNALDSKDTPGFGLDAKYFCRSSQQ